MFDNYEIKHKKIITCPKGHNFIEITKITSYNNNQYVYCKKCNRSYPKKKFKITKLKDTKNLIRVF